MQVGQISSAVQCAANQTPQWSFCPKDKPFPEMSTEGSELQQHQGANVPSNGIAWPVLSQSSVGTVLVCGIFSWSLGSSGSCTVTCAPVTQTWWGLNLPWWNGNLGRHRSADQRKMPMESVMRGWSERPCMTVCFCKVCSSLPCPISWLWTLIQRDAECLCLLWICCVPQSVLHCCKIHFSWDAEESQ